MIMYLLNRETKMVKPSFSSIAFNFQLNRYIRHCHTRQNEDLHVQKASTIIEATLLLSEVRKLGIAYHMTPDALLA